jgi:hypothetical protein
MPLQSARDFHIDQPLSNVMVGRRAPGGIVNDLVPIVTVTKQSNVYYKSNYLDNLRYEPGLTARAPGTKSREVDFTVSSDTYFAKNYALGARITDEDEANADDILRLRARKAQLVTDRLQIDYEARVAGLADAATSVATVFHVTTPWSNLAGGRPYTDITSVIQFFQDATTLKPNVAIIPNGVMTSIRNSDQVRDMLFGTNGGVATDQQVANLLGLSRILVPAIYVNTFGIKETFIGSATKSPIWSGKIWLAYVGDLTAGQEQDTWISAFRWTNPLFSQPWAVRTFPHDDEAGSQKIEASYYQGEKVVSKDLAIKIDSVI